MMHPPIILMDLDETINDSEDNFKVHSWNHLLFPFGFLWKETEGMNISGLTPVLDEQRPKIGLDTVSFCRQLVEALDLIKVTPSLERPQIAGFDPKNIDRLKQASDPDEMANILATEWRLTSNRVAKEIPAVPVPGMPDKVKDLFEAGFRIGIVTSAPREYAEAVLSSLGLVTPEKKYIATIIGGEMAKIPKPDPYSLKLATKIILLADLYKEVGREKIKDVMGSINWEQYLDEHKPVAYIGDSETDVIAGKAWGLKVIIIRGENTNLARMVELGADIITIPENIHPELFDRELSIDAPALRGEREI